MFTCSRCLAQFAPSDACPRCGAPVSVRSNVIPRPDAHRTTARGFGYVFGLHPGIAFFTIAVNLMLFSKDGLALVLAPATAGADIPVALVISMIVGAAVGYVTYLGQKKWYDDDGESARIKGLITGILTAIPTGLPGMLFGSAALAGLVLRKKR